MKAAWHVHTLAAALLLSSVSAQAAAAPVPRAVVMDRGRIVYDGASDTLRNDPAKLEQFIGVVKV